MKWNINKKEGADNITGEFEGVNVYTREGVFIAYLPVLPYSLPPPVIIWGSRTFVLTDLGNDKYNPNGKFQYREVITHYCPLYFDYNNNAWVNPYKFLNIEDEKKQEVRQPKKSCFMPSCGLDGKLCPDCQFQ